MPGHNADFAVVFCEIADPLEIEAAHPFRVRAHRNAARTVGGYGRHVAQMIGKGESLDDIPAIGTGLAAKRRESAATGSCSLLRGHGVSAGAGSAGAVPVARG